MVKSIICCICKFCTRFIFIFAKSIDFSITKSLVKVLYKNIYRDLRMLSYQALLSVTGQIDSIGDNEKKDDENNVNNKN